MPNDDTAAALQEQINALAEALGAALATATSPGRDAATIQAALDMGLHRMATRDVGTPAGRILAVLLAAWKQTRQADRGG